MNIYRRFFKATEGDLVDAITACREVNKKAQASYLEILSEIGARDEYYVREGQLVAVSFEGEPDQSIFRRVKGCAGWYPKKNNKEGKALAKRFEEVKFSREDDCLKSIGLISSPVIFDGSKGRVHMPSLVCMPSDPICVFVNVPWYDEDPKVIEKYKTEKTEGTRGDGNLDHLLWQPPKDLVEMKEWEVQREISDYNATIKP